MAYVSKEKKAEIVKALKAEFGTDAKKRGFSYTVSVRNLSAICMNIKKGSVDFLKDHTNQDLQDRGYASVMFESDSFNAEATKIIKRALKCLNLDNHDNSDIMTDYFDIGHYVEINIGSWEKPYICTK